MPLGLFEITASAATSGTTGDCTWTLDGTVLTVSGNGKMADYYDDYYYNPAPWGTDITEAIIENGVTSIGNSAFRDCSSLTNVTIGNGVTSIDYCAFYGCRSINKLSLPNGITILEKLTLYECYDLKKIYIPKSIILIEEGNFGDCTGLKDVYYEGTKEEWVKIAILHDNEYLQNAAVHYNAAGLPEQVPGDIDGVEGVTDADAEYMLMYTFFPEDYPVNQECDFNGDGKVNDADAEHLLMFTFFPEDYPLH